MGAQLAWPETQAAISALLDGLPGLRLDPERRAVPQGLIFRKPLAQNVLWDSARDGAAKKGHSRPDMS